MPMENELQDQLVLQIMRSNIVMSDLATAVHKILISAAKQKVHLDDEDQMQIGKALSATVIVARENAHMVSNFTIIPVENMGEYQNTAPPAQKGATNGR